MDESSESRYPLVAALGLLLIGSTFITGWAPQGPWGSESFSRGLFGLAGGFMIYLAWYRHNFGVWSVIPALHIWQNPHSSTRILAALGVALFFSSYLLGTVDFLPEPLSLVLLLCALLILLAAAYAWFVFEGPLGDEEE
tara:strand:+ start:616 stop:1032 length:417 start_codon:yes stop_codon:yes gene_type:complete